MHASARWIVVTAILTLSASVAPNARAAFGECTSATYLALFDERFDDPGHRDFDCVERLRAPVNTRSGLRHIRIVHDLNAGWIADDASMAAFERGARSASEAIERLGGVDLEDVTILLADDFPPREGADRFSDVAALTDFTDDGECRVIVYLAGPGGASEHAAFVIAHEIFHCVQVANLSPEQMRTGSGGTGGGGDWWMEGSANWFAGLALPDAGPLRDYVDDFDSASPTTPLNRMAYGAVVFFLWLGSEAAPNDVMMFLSGMAPTRADSEQRAAMGSALAQERWLDFAEAYLDREIRHPHGTDLGFAPAEGEVWEWSTTQTRTAPLEPFVLHRGVVAFQCGHWRTAVRPGAAHSARLEAGGAWEDLPEEIDTSSGSGGNYRFAAINVGAARVNMNVAGTMESGCGDCMGVRELDACVVGSWQLTGGGAVEWMRSQGVPINASTANTTITFRRDGTWVTGAFQGQAEMELRDGRGEGEIAAQAGGRWSTSGGVLNLCGDMQALAGEARVQTRSGTGVIPIGPAPPTDSRETYSCAGATLSTMREIPRAPPMPSEYTRIGE